MNDTLKIIIYSYSAGFPIILGGLLSCLLQSGRKRSVRELNHWFIAFGGGALMSAIAFALIPKGIEMLSIPEIVLIFLAGTGTFMLIDIFLNRIGGSFAQVMSMLMDFIPEALALGASFAYDHRFGLLMAIFIGLQNFPEGYNSFIELSSKLKKRNALIVMLLLSFSGIGAALAGAFFLSEHPQIVSLIMLYAAGGIIYLIFQDIAPLSRMKNDWLPATGASFGFLLGAIGEKLLN